MPIIQRRSLLTGSALLAVSAIVGWDTAAFGKRGSGTPAAPRRIDQAALRRFAERSKQTRSDAVTLYHDGQKVFEYYSGKPRPLPLMSCTKSIASLAIGRAIADGKIKSIDQPVYEFFPEMKQGRKAAMTIRHLLSMTSGIQNLGVGDEIYPSPDYVRLALTAELTTAPGAA